MTVVILQKGFVAPEDSRTAGNCVWNFVEPAETLPAMGAECDLYASALLDKSHLQKFESIWYNVAH